MGEISKGVTWSKVTWGDYGKGEGSKIGNLWITSFMEGPIGLFRNMSIFSS